MKKYFLDQFYVRNIEMTTSGKYKLCCYGITDESSFYFDFLVSKNEFSQILSRLNNAKRKILHWLNQAFSVNLVEIFRQAVLIDSCWLSVKELELCSDSETGPEKGFEVETYGFIPA